MSAVRMEKIMQILFAPKALRWVKLQHLSSIYVVMLNVFNNPIIIFLENLRNSRDKEHKISAEEFLGVVQGCWNSSIGACLVKKLLKLSKAFEELWS